MDHLLEEILAQPQAIRDTVTGLVDSQQASLDRLRGMGREWPRQFDVVVLTGMGSSFYALPIAAIALHQAGIPCVALETSELLHYQSNVLSTRVLLIVVSQSGESIEIVRLVEQIAARGDEHRPQMISLTSSLDNTLARSADLALRMRAGHERSIAIKTHTCTQAALALIAAALCGADHDGVATDLRAAAGALATLLNQWEDRLGPLFTHFAGTGKPFLLGRGWSQVSAAAGALALKEGGHVAAEGMSVGAFRHGTLELAGPGVDVLIFSSDPLTAGLNMGLAQELAGIGTRVAITAMEGAGAGDEPASGIPHRPDDSGDGAQPLTLRLPAVAPALAPLLEVAVAQLWSRHLALAQGRTPGELLRLPKVVRVE